MASARRLRRRAVLVNRWTRHPGLVYRPVIVELRPGETKQVFLGEAAAQAQ
jgi:hypothetical protein